MTQRPISADIERSYDLGAVQTAHRTACARAQWLRLSDMEYDAIAGTVLRTADLTTEVERLRHAMQDADKMADDPTTARAILRAALNAR